MELLAMLRNSVKFWAIIRTKCRSWLSHGEHDKDAFFQATDLRFLCWTQHTVVVSRAIHAVCVVCVSNQFGAQEPGTNQEIKKFAYGHGFTGVLMDKIDVNGAHTSPVFLWLKVNLDGPLLILPS
jgi:hypothetical protein